MMNGNLCGGFKRHRRIKRLLSSSHHQNKKHDNYGPPQNIAAIMTSSLSSSSSSVMMMNMNPRSLWAAMNFEVGLQHIYTHETKADHLTIYNNNNNNNNNNNDDVESTRQLTLEDWILSSPAQMKQSTRRIHPSFDGDNLNEELLPRSSRDRDVEVSLSYELAAENGHEINSMAGNMTMMMRKKKVRFRSPEVADVFVLPPHNIHDSPQTIDRSSICGYDDERPGLLLTNI